MRPIRTISVLMPTYQGLEFLPRVLDALAEQELDLSWDFWIVDSGSTDGTWELLGERAASFPVPLVRERIDKIEFDHGDTRNLLAARSNGELLVFLTQDAIPVGRKWLAQLASNFDDPRVGGAYCRNLPRPDSALLTRLFSELDTGYQAGRRAVRIEDEAEYRALGSHERRLLYNFNDVASALRRELWELHPFPRTSFGEDVLIARALLEAGHTVVYDDDAPVEHSHDYGPRAMHERARIDGRFNVEWLDHVCVETPHVAEVLVQRQLEVDRRALEEAGLGGAELRDQLAHAEELRRAAFLGLYEGGLSEARHPGTRFRERGSLDLLYVVHGFPPDTWAGTEIFALNLAREMTSRGHRCTVLHRVPESLSVEQGGPPDFAIHEGEFEGLRVLRWTHRLEHRNLRESYCHPAAEQAFRRILFEEKPDLVHFQHLLHSSAGLVQVARQAGLPTVVHCHDYWALCPRVQLIRPDGERCAGNQGAGCFLCINDTSFSWIPTLARLGPLAGPMLSNLEQELRSGRAPGGELAVELQGFEDLFKRHAEVTAAYAAADLQISPSRFLRAKYLESGAFDPGTFLFSDNGMRTDHLEALERGPRPAGRVRFGFVGSLVWHKGGEVLVRAMRELRGTNAELNIYGGFDPAGDEHHAELARLAEGCAIEFKGRFDNARLAEVYAEIDVLVVPSLWFENSPITIHEAFLLKTPVLTSGLGGMAEFVRDGVDGLHFAVGDADDLAAKMKRFLDEPDLVEVLSRDFMEIKTIAQNAEELEYRYRALVCRDRPGVVGEILLFSAEAVEAERSGAAELQGTDLVLLRPEPETGIEFDIAGTGGGLREIAVSTLALGSEPELCLAGRVLIDGREVGRLPEQLSRGGDTIRQEIVRVELPEDASRLRLEPVPERFLRVQRVEIRAPAVREGAR